MLESRGKVKPSRTKVTRTKVVVAASLRQGNTIESGHSDHHSDHSDHNGDHSDHNGDHCDHDADGGKYSNKEGKSTSLVDKFFEVHFNIHTCN